MNQGKVDWWIWDYSRDQVRLKLLQHSGIASFKYAECYNSLSYIKKKKGSLILKNKQKKGHQTYFRYIYFICSKQSK